jgi:hypothetical protein
MDHTGYHQLVLVTIRPTRVVTSGCRIGYVDRTGCHQLVNPTISMADGSGAWISSHTVAVQLKFDESPRLETGFSTSQAQGLGHQAPFKAMGRVRSSLLTLS